MKFVKLKKIPQKQKVIAAQNHHKRGIGRKSIIASTIPKSDTEKAQIVKAKAAKLNLQKEVEILTLTNFHGVENISPKIKSLTGIGLTAVVVVLLIK